MELPPKPAPLETEQPIDWNHEIPDPAVLAELGLANISEVVDMDDFFAQLPKDEQVMLLRKFIAREETTLCHVRLKNSGTEALISTEDSARLPIIPLREYHVTPHDAEVITTGLATLRQTLAACSPDELPTAVIYPDTTARPLHYAVHPLLQAIYAQAGRPEPKSRFFKTSMHALRQFFRSPTQESLDAYEAEHPEIFEQGMNDLEQMINRADEISEECHLSAETTVLFVDDYSSPQLHTAGRLFALFRTKTPDLPIINFAFLSRGEHRPKAPHYQYVVGSEDTRQLPFGIVAGFDYRSDPDAQLAITGVEKFDPPLNHLYARRLTPGRHPWFNPEIKAQFRQEMKDLGQQAAALITPSE